MLSRIKEIVSGNEMKELTGQLSEQLKQMALAVKEQTEIVAALKRESEESKEAAALMAAEIKKSKEAAQELQEAIRTSMADLKALSSHIQGSLKQKISDDLTILTNEAKAKLDGAEKLKHEIAASATAMVNEFSKLRGEITKLSTVAEKIKAEDFELARFSNQLLAADKEKLQLMSKIDSLERLIAKMRRA